MNMFARFDENPTMNLQDIRKKTLRTDAGTDRRRHGQRENSIPPTNKVCGGYKKNHENHPACKELNLQYTVNSEIFEDFIFAKLCI